MTGAPHTVWKEPILGFQFEIHTALNFGFIIDLEVNFI